MSQMLIKMELKMRLKFFSKKFNDQKNEKLISVRKKHLKSFLYFLTMYEINCKLGFQYFRIL